MNIFNVSLVPNSLSHTCRFTSRGFQLDWRTSVYDETVHCIKLVHMRLGRLLSLVGFSEVNWRFELTASPFPLLGEDKDQIKIQVPSASHTAMEEGFLKVRGYNWLLDRADDCGGQGTDCEREETVTDLWSSIVSYFYRIKDCREVGWRICCYQ